MFTCNSQGEQRASPAVYRLLLTAHIIASVGWLGVVVAKVVLGLTAVTTGADDTAEDLAIAMNVLNVAFPPLALGTIITGSLLSFGTRWRLLKHSWVVTKIVLTVGVITTAVRLIDRLAQPAGQAALTGAILGIEASPVALLLSLSLAHLLMLLTATVISVYKPWGKTRFGRLVVRLSPGKL